MKKFSEQLKKQAESVRLRGSERRELRERLISYMEYHPLPAELKNAELMPAVVKQRVQWFKTNIVMRYASALAVLLVMTVPVIAERTVPGDVLYPIKVRFNEEVRSSLALSPYQKVEWETERLERRISEARLLADAGKLTPEVGAEVAEAVKQHSDAAQKEIAAIRESDSEEAAIAELTFASALEVQSEVLQGHAERVSSTGETEGSSVDTVAGAVDAAREAAAAAKSPDTPSFARLMAHLETETTRAYEYFDTVSKVASESEVKDIEDRLKDIQKKVDNAKKQREVDDADATAGVELLKQALTDTRKLISFITNIDVRENVTIEELVPLSPADENRTAEVLNTLEDIDDGVADINAQKSGFSTSTAAEVEVRISTITNLQAQATAAIDDGDIDAAVQNTDKAFAKFIDLQTFIASEMQVEGDTRATSTKDSETKASTTSKTQ